MTKQTENLAANRQHTHSNRLRRHRGDIMSAEKRSAVMAKIKGRVRGLSGS